MRIRGSPNLIVDHDRVLSVPTMCLHCHLIVELEHKEEVVAGVDNSTWVCPKCAHVYPARHWKIKVARGKVPA